MTPSINRVYGLKAPELAVAELRYVSERFVPGAVSSVERVHEAGLDAIRVSIDDAVWEEPAQRRILMRIFARSPHVFALCEEVGRMPVLEHDGADGDGNTTASGVRRDGDSERVYVDEMESVPLLQPRPLPGTDLYPSDLLTTLKYQGKTNEQFTALMLHLAAATSARRADLDTGTLRVLDPVAGRGTTLNQALMWGLSPVGVDLDKKDAELYRGFLTGWLREHRLKHKVGTHKLTVHGKALGSRTHADLAATKEAHKAGEGQTLDLYTADTTKIGSFLSPRSADAIVADLPYGVQHGARSGGALKRSPLELLEEALPAWTRVLSKGGAMALAINRHTAPWPDTAALLERQGLTVTTADGEFRHRVDSSIDRDIVVAAA